MSKSKDVEIKSVLFDMGNVLLHYDAPKACMRFSKECKVPFHKIWKHFFTDKTEKAYTRGEITSFQFYKHAKKRLDFPVDYPTFKKYWNEIFWENKGMEDILKKLKKKYPLYLISNTNDLHFTYIRENFKILRHFKRLFPSHKVGARKPDVTIYKRVLRKVRLKPEETVFIDDVSKFIRGAKKAGMHGIQYKNNRQLIRDLKKLNVQV